MRAADQEYSKLDSERKKKKSKLEDEIREEEHKLYARKESLKMRRKGIIFSLIILFVLAIIGGIALGYYWISNGYIEVPKP